MRSKEIVRFIAYATLFLTFWSYAEAFYRAYLNGYVAIVHINDFGEAFAEVVWITLAIPCVLYIFADMLWGTEFFRKLRKRGKKSR